MANRAKPTGEMRDVGGAKGAKLTVIPEQTGESPPPQPQEEKKADQPPTPGVPVPAAPKVVRLQIQAEFGSFEEKAESLEAARSRAEEIVVKGAWQNTGNQMILHGPNVIRRVVVTQ